MLGRQPVLGAGAAGFQKDMPGAAVSISSRRFGLLRWRLQQVGARSCAQFPNEVDGRPRIQSIPTLRVLSDEQIYQIRQARLETLWRTGIFVKAPQARGVLRQAGVRVDEQTVRCHIPGYIVEKAVKRAPSSFTIHARNPAPDVHVSTQALHYEPMIGRLNGYDFLTGTTRRTTLEDVGHLIKISDALPH